MEFRCGEVRDERAQGMRSRNQALTIRRVKSVRGGASRASVELARLRQVGRRLRRRALARLVQRRRGEHHLYARLSTLKTLPDDREGTYVVSRGDEPSNGLADLRGGPAVVVGHDDVLRCRVGGQEQEGERDGTHDGGEEGGQGARGGGLDATA